MKYQKMPFSGLVSDMGVCQSSMEHDRPCPISGTGMHCPGGTSLEYSAMVATFSTNVSGGTVPDQTLSESRSAGSRPTTSHVAYLRERYRDQGLTEEATSLTLKSRRTSWRTKTINFTTYSSGSGIAGVIQRTQILFQVL